LWEEGEGERGRRGRGEGGFCCMDGGRMDGKGEEDD